MENIQIKVPAGTTKKKKMIGRGTGSGHGKTSCRGHNGQNSRSGGGVRPGFEGGQMPLYRRIARRGFSNSRFKKEYNIVNVRDLVSFEDGSTVDKEALINIGKIRHKNLPIKLLGDGDLDKKLVVKLDKISKIAKEKVEKCGGEVTIEEKEKEVGKE